MSDGRGSAWRSAAGSAHWLQFDSIRSLPPPQGFRFWWWAEALQGPLFLQLQLRHRRRWYPYTRTWTRNVSSFAEVFRAGRAPPRLRCRRLRLRAVARTPFRLAVAQWEWLPTAAVPRPPAAPAPLPADLALVPQRCGRRGVAGDLWVDLGGAAPLAAGMRLRLGPAGGWRRPVRLAVDAAEAGGRWRPLLPLRRCVPWFPGEERHLRFPAVRFAPRWYRLRLRGPAGAPAGVRVESWVLCPPSEIYASLPMACIDAPALHDEQCDDEVSRTWDAGSCTDEVVGLQLQLQARGRTELALEHSVNGCRWQAVALPAVEQPGGVERTCFLPQAVRARYFRAVLRGASPSAPLAVRRLQLLRCGSPVAAVQRPLRMDESSLQQLTRRHGDPHATPLAVLLLALYSLCTTPAEYVQAVQAVAASGVVCSDGTKTCYLTLL
jgi:hypothetical protein